MNNSVYVKCIKTHGEIPERSIGFHRGSTISGGIDYTRVFVPRQYTGLDKDSLPCYDMPLENERAIYWSEILEEMLTDEEKKMLTDLETEINSKENFFIGPDGMFMRTMGDVNKIKDVLEGMSDNEI